jgi:hypothetical protein
LDGEGNQAGFSGPKSDTEAWVPQRQPHSSLRCRLPRWCWASEVRAMRMVIQGCGSRKPRRPTESTPKGLVSDALRSEGERVQAANSVSYRWKEESGFGLHSPARTLPVIGATTRRVMGGNEATLPTCSDDADRRRRGWPPLFPAQRAQRRAANERCRPEPVGLGGCRGNESIGPRRGDVNCLTGR